MKIEGLPAHGFERDGEYELQPCAEVLLSDRAAYITGQLVQPDGGRVMW